MTDTPELTDEDREIMYGLLLLMLRHTTATPLHGLTGPEHPPYWPDTPARP